MRKTDKPWANFKVLHAYCIGSQLPQIKEQRTHEQSMEGDMPNKEQCKKLYRRE
jgi:hypothetical protein